MSIRVGINGFGRIGRNVLRAAYGTENDLQIVAVNDISDIGTLAHLLRYDSIQGRFDGSVEENDDGLVVDGAAMKVLAMRDPGSLPWKDLEVDVVLESTGLFTKRDDAAKHIAAGAKKVLISAPAKDEDITIVLGVNHDRYDPSSHDVISNASCTTNCLVPVVKVLRESFGFVRGFMTTVHSYTNDQRILDLPHKDLRRARAAAQNIIPTSTGAARATGLVIPEVAGKIDGVALRVPTADVSIVELVCEVERGTSIDAVNDAFREAAAEDLAGVLGASDEPLVSTDYLGDPRSSIVDLLSTNVVNETMVHISSWYDNEVGYSHRCVDMLGYIGERL